MNSRKARVDQTAKSSGNDDLLLRPRDEALHEMTAAELRKLVDELREEQVELRRQNDELRRAQAQLSESRDWYPDNQEFADIGRATVDDDGSILDADSRLVKLLGRKQESLVGIPFLTLVVDTDHEAYHLSRQSAQQPGQVTECELRLLREGETPFWAAIRGTAVEAGSLGVIQLRLAIADITERKQTEEELRLLQFSIDQASASVFRVTPEGQLTYVNEAACRSLGCTREELIGSSLEKIDPLFREDKRAEHWQRLKARGTATFETLHRTKDGHIFPVEVTDHYLCYGDVEYEFAYATDISDRKKTEEGLRQNEELLNEMGSIARIGGWEHNLLIGEARWTRGTYEIVEIESGPIPGPNEHLDYYLPPDRAILDEAYQRAVTTGEPFDLELQVSTAKGRQIWVRAVGHPIFSDGRCVKLRGILQDITEQKQSRRLLQEKELRLSTLMDNLPGMAYRCRNLPDWPMEFLSSGCLALTGYAAQELAEDKRLSYEQLIHDDDKQAIWDAVQLAVDRNEPFELEYRIRTKDGQEKWVWERGQHTGVTTDGVGVLEGLITDITDRKRAEVALRESENRFRELFNNMSNGVAVYDVVGDGEDFVFKDVNPAGVRIGKLPQEEHIGRSVQEVYPGVRELGLFDVFCEVWRTGEPRRHRVTQYQDNRLSLWLDNYVCKLPTGEIVAVYEDVSERKRTEAALRESEEKFRAVFERAPDFMVLTDFETRRIVDFNNRAHETLGYTREEFAKLSIADFEARDTPEEIAARVQKIFTTGQATFETKHRTKDGRVLDVLVNARRISIGGRPSLLAIVADISERKQAEANLARAKEAAEAANRAKSEFLAHMSHEIRTPLTAITGFAELLLGEDCPVDERREYLATIQRNASNLLEIINGILDLSKIEAEKVQLEKMDCSPRQIVDEVQTLMRGRADDKQLLLRVECIEPLPSTVHTDPGKLRQILVNLLDNAIKYTDSGGVTITVRNTPPRDHRSQLQFELVDTGVGIGAAEIRDIFEPFTQVNHSSTAPSHGAGLGLCISRRLAEMLGGRLEVQSEPGKGSTFTLTIDIGPTDRMWSRTMPVLADRLTTAWTAETFDGHVLLADDVPDMSRLMKCTLEKIGLRLDLAENGLVACEKALASQAAGKPYDLILMDIRMPIMDGYEATQRLRAEGWQGPIVALTAHSMRGEREKCLEVGCDDYLSKPVDQPTLFVTLGTYLERKQRQPAGEAAHGPSMPSAELFDGLLDDDTVAELVTEYARTLLAKAEAIEAALREQDLESLAGLAHELKGTAGMYGFTSVSEQALLLKQLAAEAENVHQLQATVVELTELCRATARTGMKKTTNQQQ